MTDAEISPGEYNLRIILQGPADIKDTSYEEGGIIETVPGFKNPNWQLGSIDIPFTFEKQDFDKSSIIFYVFEENDVMRLNPGTWDDINTIIQADNSLEYNVSGKIISIPQSEYTPYLQPVIS